MNSCQMMRHHKATRFILFTFAILFSFAIAGGAHSSGAITFKPSQKYGNAFSLYRTGAGNEMLTPFTKTPAGILKVVFQECGMINAFYSPANQSITVCYELDDAIQSVIRRDFKGASLDKQAGLRVGAFLFIFLHEFGHAVIDMAKLPILGGEEDAADRFAAIALLSSEDARKINLAKEAIEGGLAFFGANKKPGIFDAFKKKNYADEHPLNEQRVFNILCLGYGSDPALFSDMVVSQNMPKSRLVRCGEEYRDAKRALDELLKTTSASNKENNVLTDDEMVVEKIRKGAFVPRGGGIRAPDVVAEGAVTPVEISLTNPLANGDCLYVMVDDFQVSHKICPRGDVQIQMASLRIKLPATGRIVAAVAKQAGEVGLLYKQVQVTGYKPDIVVAPLGLGMKNKAQRLGEMTEIKMLVNSAMTREDYVRHVNYQFDSADKIDVYMTPWASKNPYIGIKAVSSTQHPSYLVTVLGNSGVKLSENVVVQ